MTTTKYAVYRHGCNAANQGYPKVLVEVVEAKSAAEACELAEAHCYNNQTLSARPWSKVSRKEANEYLNALAEIEAWS